MSSSVETESFFYDRDTWCRCKTFVFAAQRHHCQFTEMILRERADKWREHVARMDKLIRALEELMEANQSGEKVDDQYYGKLIREARHAYD